jgi:glucan phosphorylase
MAVWDAWLHVSWIHSHIEIPAMAMASAMEYGIFFQHIKACEQLENPDNWLRYGVCGKRPVRNDSFPCILVEE